MKQKQIETPKSPPLLKVCNLYSLKKEQYQIGWPRYSSLLLYLIFCDPLTIFHSIYTPLVYNVCLVLYNGMTNTTNFHTNMEGKCVYLIFHFSDNRGKN